MHEKSHFYTVNAWKENPDLAVVLTYATCGKLFSEQLEQDFDSKKGHSFISVKRKCNKILHQRKKSKPELMRQKTCSCIIFQDISIVSTG